MTKPLTKTTSELRLPVLDGKGGMVPGIRPDSNASILDAAEGFSETAHLLAEPANAEHLRKSISQYRAVRTRIKKP